MDVVAGRERREKIHHGGTRIYTERIVVGTTKGTPVE
jgi:hypothetical protein